MSGLLRRSGFVLACALAAPVLAQDGQYDPRFGNYLPGRTLHQPLPDSSGQAWAMAVMPDGRLVLAGDAMSIRFGASGVPDLSFGNGAFGVEGVFAVQPFGAQAGFLSPSAVLRQADGKLLFAGSAEGTDFRSRWVVCRTSADGILDTSYGDGGCTGYVVEQGHDAYVAAAALDHAGRVVLAGYGYFTFGSRIVVARLRPDGSLDTSYGTNGRTVVLRFEELAGIQTYEQPYGLAIDATGRAIVVGDTGPANVHDFGVARLGADGLLDPAFGDGGARVVDFAGQQQTDMAYAVAVQRSGRILVAGFASFAGTDAGMAVLALTDAGDVDPGFGNLAGRSIVWPVATTAYAFATSLAIQNDGRIVLGGYAENPADGGAAGQDVAVVRLHADGTGPDAGFATGGVFMAGFDLGSAAESSDDRLYCIGLQGNRIVAAGGAEDDWPDGWFSAIRLTEDRVFADGAERPK
jgi:uncharacterized delta-60 repeat protein